MSEIIEHSLDDIKGGWLLLQVQGEAGGSDPTEVGGAEI
jgi:hypothetical protein